MSTLSIRLFAASLIVSLSSGAYASTYYNHSHTCTLTYESQVQTTYKVDLQYALSQNSDFITITDGAGNSKKFERTMENKKIVDSSPKALYPILIAAGTAGGLVLGLSTAVAAGAIIDVTLGAVGPTTISEVAGAVVVVGPTIGGTIQGVNAANAKVEDLESKSMNQNQDLEDLKTCSVLALENLQKLGFREMSQE